MSGMKPKIVCAQCGSTLNQTDVLCPSCGVVIDWVDTANVIEPVSGNDIPETNNRKNKSQIKNKSASLSSKLIPGVIAVIAFAVIAYAVFIEKRPGVSVDQQQTNQPMNAAMQSSEIQELENSVEANPDNMSLTLQLANLLHDYLSYEKAISYYKVYLKMNPKNADVRVDMGICYKELNKFTEAKNEMKTALLYVPNHVNAHFNLGIVCLSEGNMQESNTWFKKTVALDPNGEVGKRAQQLLTQHNSQTTK